MTKTSLLGKGLTIALSGLLFTTTLATVNNTHAIPSTKFSDTNGISESDLKVDTIVSGLKMPWATAYLPNGDLLVTERVGKLRIVRNGKLDPKEITGLPEILYKGQGGLLDVVLHPNYAKNGWIYISYSSPKKDNEAGDDDGANTALLRAKLKGNALTNVELLYKALPNVKGPVHYGGRIIFDKKGHVFLSLGERGQKENAQDLSKGQGKIVRLKEDGKIPADNPFVNVADAKPEFYSFGHRNPQGLVYDDETGTIWEHEHGPQGGDELNIVRPGKNYGWPVITYGIDYDNSIISSDSVKVGFEQPMTYWKPSIAPCGMAMITSDKFKDWKGDLIVGSLKFSYLQHLTIKDNQVVDREILFEKLGRVRDVRQGSDGNLYVVLENSGKVVRISPKQ